MRQGPVLRVDVGEGLVFCSRFWYTFCGIFGGEVVVCFKATCAIGYGVGKVE